MPGGHQRLTESADEKGAATSPKNRQLPPRRKARKQCEFPRAFTCSHPANGPQPPPLRYARRRLVPCGHAPALAARKKAARPVRPRTRPCRRQEGGSSCAATHPPLRHGGHAPALAAGKKAARPVRPRTRPCGTQEGGLSRPATDRLVLPGHGPACPVRSRTRTGGQPIALRTGGQPIALRARAAVRPAFLSAAPFKAVELRSTPGKLLKKFDQNFFAPPAALFRPCGTQKGGLSRPATDRLVLCGHAPLTCLRRILQTPGLQSPH